jgi:4-hydroxybenzoate polyprenyltransferase
MPFCGIALLGGLLSRQSGNSIFPVALGFAVIGVFFMASFAFTFNDLQDIEHDRQSGSKSSRPIVDGSLSFRAARLLSALVAAVGLLLLYAGTSWFVLCVGLSTIPVGIAYSWRRFPLKTVPVLSSLTHLVFGTQVSIIGAWSVSRPDLTSLATGVYFGLLFAAGHLHHEVADLEVDRRSNVRTHAVRYGGKSIVRAGFSLLCISCVYFSMLAMLGIMPAILGWIQLGMFSCYMVGFFLILKGSWDPQRIKRLQKVYRIAYLAGGLLMVTAIILRSSSW